jgi:subtilisin family serine protease
MPLTVILLCITSFRNGLAVAAAGNGRCIGPDCATLTKCKRPEDCPDGSCNCAVGPVDHMDSDPAVPGGGVVHVPSSLAVSLPDCVISVAAVDRNNRLGSFSNFGAGVRIVAPGVDITSDLPVAGTEFGYGVISGTSVVSCT